jgi:2-polyprenyl-6-methoxyphenol hydroxylase-like FAD-dependent oxidoreductase
MNTDVVIVGGGVAGLGAAIALAPHGLDVTVIERRAQVGGIHRGDSLLPKSVALLTRWGLRDALVAAGARPIFRMEIHAPGSKEAFEVPLTRHDAEHPYHVLPHARLEAVLMKAALALPNVHVVRPASFVDLVRNTATGRAAGVRYRRGDAVEEISCRLVVAADGQHSSVRKRAGIAFDAYRYDHAYFGLESDRPAGYRDAMRVHLHAEGGALLMPHPDRIGVGILVEAGSARRWMTMNEAALSYELVKRAPILSGVTLHLEGAHVYELCRAHADRYTSGGVVLIGDSAHCANPTAGQGMAMALSDAGALADAIGREWRDDVECIEALAHRYEARAWRVNQRLVWRAHWLAKLYSLRGTAWTRAKALGVMALARPALHRLTRPVLEHFILDPRA